MTHHATEVITGAVVVAAAAGFLVYASQFAGAAGAGAGFYEMSASFRSIEGVRVGTDVRLGGVKVGTVTGLTLNPSTFRADAVFTVQETLALPEDTAVVVSSEGLLGGSFLELLPGGSPFNLEPGGVIEDTQSSVSLITLLMRFVSGDGSAE
jgi:phospholipid/cholesterol/gamma-HCH transport system substrate-binding protein